MGLEDNLVHKTYYTTFIEDENEAAPPVQKLAEAFLQAQHSEEEADFDKIRFAQAEVYFHLKDYETAIFKWQQVEQELQPWAKKNIADAYYALGQLLEAKRLYKLVDMADPTLGTEVALKLFAIYRDLVELDQAARVIKGVVSINPDYPNVTSIARSFFEEYTDWSNAIELAVNEALRTHSLEWFAILQSYVDKGVTRAVTPAYFVPLLTTLYALNKNTFIELACSMWSSYQKQEFHYSWVTTFNELLRNVNVSESDKWKELVVYYEVTYLDWMSGSYLINELADVMPNLVSNWVRISDSEQAAFAAAAVLSWNDAFPSSIQSDIVNEAEAKLHLPHQMDGFERAAALYETVVKWTKENNVEVDNRLCWLVNELRESTKNHLAVIGISGEEKAALLQAILGERTVDAKSSGVVIFKEKHEKAIKEITDGEELRELTVTEFQQLSASRRRTPFVEYALPCAYLREHNLTLVDTPVFKEKETKAEEWLSYLHTADSLLVVLTSKTHFNELEREMALKIKEQMPHIPIQFALTFLESSYQEQETNRLLQITKAKVRNIFPEANVFAFHPNFPHVEENSFTKRLIKQNKQETRTANLLYYIRKLISDLLDRRVEIENYLVESIRWNEELLTKLNGATHQITDLEKGQVEMIKRSYTTVIKEELKKEISNTIPILLKDCAHLLKDNTDYRTVHVALDKEMNVRIENYIEHTVVPQFRQSLFGWIEDSKETFDEIQATLHKMADGFNTLCNEERFKLDCDFQILKDWERDADRLTNMVKIEQVNILVQNKPAQLLLVNSGKLFGSLANKAMAFKMYKKFIENENYEEVVASVTEQFLQQFDFFEKSLERDIQIFFREPLNSLQETSERTRLLIKENKLALNDLQITPQVYVDPLTLFKVRLQQLNLLSGTSRKVEMPLS